MEATLGDRLRSARMRTSATREDLSFAVTDWLRRGGQTWTLTAEKLEAWEEGRTSPMFSELGIVCCALGADPRWVRHGERDHRAVVPRPDPPR